ncbi:MAG: hypothetical protein WAU47_06910 [Desulfobaccales bacterium]
MAVGNSIQGPNPVIWPGTPDLRTATPGLGEGQPRSGGRRMPQTSQEALTHIEVLYKSGRMGELASLLRQHQVFRDAWLMMQQSSLAGNGPAGNRKEPVQSGKTQESSGFPVPQAERPPPNPLAKSVGEAYSPLTSGASGLGPRAARRSPAFANTSYIYHAALEAYRKQAVYGDQQQDGRRLNIKV